jgi:hypothetical protein
MSPFSFQPAPTSRAQQEAVSPADSNSSSKVMTSGVTVGSDGLVRGRENGVGTFIGWLNGDLKPPTGPPDLDQFGKLAPGSLQGEMGRNRAPGTDQQNAQDKGTTRGPGDPNWKSPGQTAPPPPDAAPPPAASPSPGSQISPQPSPTPTDDGDDIIGSDDGGDGTWDEPDDLTASILAYAGGTPNYSGGGSSATIYSFGTPTITCMACHSGFAAGLTPYSDLSPGAKNAIFMAGAGPSLDQVQSALDYGGLVDQSGAVDAVNAGISALRGNYVAAGISLAAAVPALGLLNGLRAFRGLKGAANVSDNVAGTARGLAPKGSGNPAVSKAAGRGSTLHSDKPGHLPDQLRQRYPETEFDMKKPGVPGQDVQVVGGKHPSDYPDLTWPKGTDYGDFKPDTPGGRKTFNSDQKNKWPDPTNMLPYDPKTGKLQ